MLRLAAKQGMLGGSSDGRGVMRFRNDARGSPQLRQVNVMSLEPETGHTVIGGDSLGCSVICLVLLRFSPL